MALLTDPAPDADARTLHLRCGSDIRDRLRTAGFSGDFLEHSYPYLIGPVRDEGPGVLEERARFVDVPVAEVVAAERRLDEAQGYERAVIWSEHDVYDQLELLRLLSHFARAARRPRVELILVDHWPGLEPFLGLGQLDAEDLASLWPRRREVTDAQFALGERGWRALASADPRELARLAREGTPDLPPLAPALRRHIAELPDVATGLGLTESLALRLIAEEGPLSLQRLFARLTYEGVDPLPGQGDFQVRDRVLAMERAARPLLTRSPGVDANGRARSPWTDRLAIASLGRAVLAGETDYLSLHPPPRWVGGVEVRADRAAWRWNESVQDVELN